MLFQPKSQFLHHLLGVVCLFGQVGSLSFMSLMCMSNPIDACCYDVDLEFGKVRWESRLCQLEISFVSVSTEDVLLEPVDFAKLKIDAPPEVALWFKDMRISVIFYKNVGDNLVGSPDVYWPQSMHQPLCRAVPASMFKDRPRWSWTITSSSDLRMMLPWARCRGGV